MVIQVRYSQEIAATLTDDDRAELRITDKDGTRIADAVSSVPYEETHGIDGDGKAVNCRTAHLDFDGNPPPDAGP